MKPKNLLSTKDTKRGKQASRVTAARKTHEKILCIGIILFRDFRVFRGQRKFLI